MDSFKNVWLLAYCVPDRCTAEDLNSAISELLDSDLLKNNSLFNDEYCSTKKSDREIDTGAIVTL